MFYKFFNKKTSAVSANKFAGCGIAMLQNKKLAEELHKPIIKKFKTIRIYYLFKDNVWGADLADMQLISKFNKGINFLLCATYIFSKYAWVIPLKDKKGMTIVNAFQKVLNKSELKPNKIWVDKGSEFCNRLMKSWLEKMA